jgi:hypothetical protein
MPILLAVHSAPILCRLAGGATLVSGRALAVGGRRRTVRRALGGDAGTRDDARGAGTPVRTPPTRLDTTAPPPRTAASHRRIDGIAHHCIAPTDADRR